MHDEHDVNHDELHRGLAHDLDVLRRRAAAEAIRRRPFLAGAGALALLGCSSTDAASADATAGTGGTGGSDGSSTGGGAGGTGGSDAIGGSATNGGSSSGAGGADNGTCQTIPEETAGPYPGDGSNGPNVLNLDGIVRSDIRTSFATLSGTAEGIELTVTLTIVSATTCEALVGYAVYLWHCDRDGNYSLYTAANENYLRGVQETDANGQVTFTTIFPACYSGRWPHIHYEVYPSLAEATDVNNKIATTQLALPQAQCDEVYTTEGYEQSVTNLSQVSLATDMVFSDGATLETPTVTGAVSDGYVATLTASV